VQRVGAERRVGYCRAVLRVGAREVVFERKRAVVNHHDAMDVRLSPFDEARYNVA
jgi:hypothetical protein